MKRHLQKEYKSNLSIPGFEVKKEKNSHSCDGRFSEFL